MSKSDINHVRVGATRATLVISPGGDAPASTEPRSFWNTLIVASTLCIPLIIIGLGVSYRLNLARQLSDEIAALRAAGLPSEQREYHQWHASVPEEENASFSLLRALGSVDAIEALSEERRYFEDSYRWPDARIPDADAAVIQRAIDRRADALEQVREALNSDRSVYRFIAGRTRDYSALFWGWRTCVKLFQANAVLAADRGAGDEAVENLLAILGLAQSLHEEPVSAGQLRRFETVHYLLAGIEQVLGRTALNQEQLARLRDGLAQIDLRAGLLRVVAGQRAMLLQHEDWSMFFADHVDSPLLDTLGGKTRAKLLFLDAMEQASQVFSLSGQEAMQEWEALLTENRMARYYLDRRLYQPTLWHNLELRLQATRLALALEVHQREHAEFPQSLSVLEEAARLIDPFTGAPFQYRRHEHGYSIYSTGSDGIDDGGDTRVVPMLSMPGALTVAPDTGITVLNLG